MGLITLPLPQLLLRDIAGGLQIHEKARGLVADEVKRLLLGTEAMTGVHHGQPGAISVGTERVYAVSEALLRDALFGPSYTAYVAGVVCSGKGPVDHGIIARLAKEARAIRLAHVTATSLKVFLLPPVFGKRPKLVRKGTAAALAEAVAAALSEHETARRVDLEMAPAAFDKALGPDPLSEGRAKGASRAPGLLPRLATGCGEAIVTAFVPRTREYAGFGAGCWLLLGSAAGPRCAC